MTTWASTTRVRHDSDATFREWGSEFAAALLAVGLTQTADTGQINWTTVTRPGVNTNGGYEIWRFNDAQQSTAPIFMRIDYGTGSNAQSPRIMFTVGTGSNGSGTITGTALTSSFSTNAIASAQTSDTTRNTVMCYVDGFFGFNWKQASSAEGSFFVARTVDNTGAATATGAIVFWGAGAPGSGFGTQALRFAATALAFTRQTTVPGTALCLNPQLVTTSTVAGNNQAFLAWTITPQVTPVVGVCGVLDAELTTNATFTEALIGSTPRTYIGWAPAGGAAGPVSAGGTGGLKFAMLWE